MMYDWVGWWWWWWWWWLLKAGSVASCTSSLNVERARVGSLQSFITSMFFLFWNLLLNWQTEMSAASSILRSISLVEIKVSLRSGFDLNSEPCFELTLTSRTHNVTAFQCIRSLSPSLTHTHLHSVMHQHGHAPSCFPLTNDVCQTALPYCLFILMLLEL